MSDSGELSRQSYPHVDVAWTDDGFVELTLVAPDGRSFTLGLDPGRADEAGALLKRAAASASRARRGLSVADIERLSGRHESIRGHVLGPEPGDG